MKGNTHLTYLEIVIMVVVIGLIGRTFLPKFAQAGDERNISRLIDALEKMRAGIDLYHAQHGDCLPPCDSFEDFEDAMTAPADGHEAYVETIPTNPFNRLKTVRFDGEPAGCGKAGWRFDSETGLFQADHSSAYANF